MGGLIIAAFHWFPAFNAFLVELGVKKAEWGYGYSCLSTAFLGDLFLIACFFYKANSQREKAGLLTFFLIFWGVKGMEVDAFYRLQGYFFGYSANVQTILSKVLVDQFVYCIFGLLRAPPFFMAGSEQVLHLGRIVTGYR